MTATTRPRRRARLLAACAGIAVGAVLLAGCEGSPGAAATVGDVTITEQQLADEVAELAADPESGVAADDPAVVNSLLARLVTMTLVDKLAVQHDVKVTDGQIAAELAAYEAQVGGREAVYQVFAQQGVPASQVEPMVRLTLQATALGPVLAPPDTGVDQTQAIVEAIVMLSDAEGVEVNPRWGSWDATTLNLGPAPDDLATVPS